MQVLREPLSHLLYADDLVLISTSQEGLNNCLHKLGEFCTTWQLELNLKKSQVIIFNTTGRLLSGFSFNCQGKPMQIVKTYCYLGIDLSCSGSFNIGRTNIMEKARKAMSPLFSIIPDFKISCRNSLKLFNSFIRPIALYNSENLAHLTQHQIQAMVDNKTTLLEYLTTSKANIIHQKILKFILGVKRNCGNMATLGELGEFPLHIYGLISLLSYWHRTAMMQEDTFAKQALNFVTNDGPNVSDWFATVKFLLKMINMEEYILNPESITTKNFTDNCSKKLKDILTEQWRTAISRNQSKNGQSNKLKFYGLFKTTFEMEPYLENVNNFIMRKNICKFRCSDHRLEIELGRHKGANIEERICKLCRGSVESEIHFLTQCPLYRKYRLKYLGTDIIESWMNIIQCKDKHIAFNFANFLTKSMNLRKRMLDLHAYFN